MNSETLSFLVGLIAAVGLFTQPVFMLVIATFLVVAWKFDRLSFPILPGFLIGIVFFGRLCDFEAGSYAVTRFTHITDRLPILEYRWNVIALAWRQLHVWFHQEPDRMNSFAAVMAILFVCLYAE